MNFGRLGGLGGLGVGVGLMNCVRNTFIGLLPFPVTWPVSVLAPPGHFRVLEKIKLDEAKIVVNDRCRSLHSTNWNFCSQVRRF